MLSGDPYVFSNQLSIPAPVSEVFADFFRSWDDVNSEGEGYLSFFTPEGQLIFPPSTTVKGRDEIRSFRNQMVNAERGPVVALQHCVDKCWLPAGGHGASKEKPVLITGYIWYKLKNGRIVDGNFASQVVLVDDENGKLQATFYEVYIDTLELTNAVKELV